MALQSAQPNELYSLLVSLLISQLVFKFKTMCLVIVVINAMAAYLVIFMQSL